MNSSAKTDFSSLCVEYISISLSCKNDFTDVLQNSLPLSTHILFGLQLNFFIFFSKAFYLSKE